MTAADSLEILNRQRAGAVAACMARPVDWKMCGCCSRLVAVARPLCPFCDAYQFDTSPAAVWRAAKRDMQRERPLVLPRWNFTL
jgi:hypothetical protein